MIYLPFLITITTLCLCNADIEQVWGTKKSDKLPESWDIIWHNDKGLLRNLRASNDEHSVRSPAHSSSKDLSRNLNDNFDESTVKPGSGDGAEKLKSTIALAAQSKSLANRSITGKISDTTFIVIIAGCSSAALVAIVMAIYCWYKARKTEKEVGSIDYPQYGVTGPSMDRLATSHDRKMAHSAQMYHYQHTKEKILAMEAANGETKKDVESDDAEDGNGYTVYECPGLAPAGEMEVTNPLYAGESESPLSTSARTSPVTTPSSNPPPPYPATEYIPPTRKQ